MYVGALRPGGVAEKYVKYCTGVEILTKIPFTCHVHRTCALINAPLFLHVNTYCSLFLQLDALIIDYNSATCICVQYKNTFIQPSCLKYNNQSMHSSAQSMVQYYSC